MDQQSAPPLSAAGAPASEILFVLLVRAVLRMGLTCACDLIIGSALILAWRRVDPDAAIGHAPPIILVRCYAGTGLHTLLCRGSSWPMSGRESSWTSRSLFPDEGRTLHLQPLLVSGPHLGQPRGTACIACGRVGPQ